MYFLNSATSDFTWLFAAEEQANGRKGRDHQHTFCLVSTNHAILYERLRPVFADVDEYLCLTPIGKEDIPKTRAVIFVGMGAIRGV
jgi:hypothetical protein